MGIIDSILAAFLFDTAGNAPRVSLAVSFQSAATAMLGCHLIARKRALLSDALSHASLPGVGLGFLIMLLFGEESEWKREIFVTAGAFLMMVVCLIIIWQTKHRIKRDAVLALALSGFYALGIVLLSYIQVIPSGAKAGLETYILGQSATINFVEMRVIMITSLIVFVFYAMMHRQWMLICFDESFARVSGIRVGRQDLLILLLSVMMIAVGIRAMGLILIVALFTIPPLIAAMLCRSWHRMLLSSALIGALAAHAGVSVSAGLQVVPSGVSVVLICALIYIVVFLATHFGSRLKYSVR